MTLKQNIKMKDYSVLKKAASGLWGTLYKVKHKKTGKVAALKELFFECPMDYDSLAQEFKYLIALDHKNLVKIHTLDIGPEGLPYHIMDDVPGNPLLSVMNQSKSAWEQFNDIVSQILDGLDYLHQKGFRHHDLHPNNILLHKEGKRWKVTITDYSLYDIVGCPDIYQRDMENRLNYAAYLSPEVITGNSPDYRSDYYSLGVILYEILTGDNPFAKNSLQSIISSHLNQYPVSPAELSENVTETQNSIILQMLAKEPSFRPTTATVIKNALCGSNLPSLEPPLRTSGMFVGQNLPLKELRTAFESACQGQGKILLVHGEKGIGKSRLLQEIRTDFLLSGAHVVDVVFDQETESSRDLFQNLFEKMSHVNPRISKDLTSLIYRKGLMEHPFAAADKAVLNRAHHHAAKRLLADLEISDDDFASSPQVVIIRNFHCSDKIPWLFLDELGRYWEQQSPANIPCLFLIETDVDTWKPLINSTSKSRLSTVELVGLNPEDTGILLSSLLSVTPFPTDLTDTIHRVSRGIPWKIVLIAQFLREANILEEQDESWFINDDNAVNLDIDIDLHRMFQQMINLESKPKLRILKSLAVWNRAIEARDIRYGFVQEKDSETHLMKLVRDGLVMRNMIHEKIFYSLCHPVLKEVLLEEIPVYQQNEKHNEIIDYLMKESPENLWDIAYHMLRGKSRFDGCEWALKAARKFREEGKSHPAVYWFKQTIEAMPERNVSMIAQVNYELAQCQLINQDFSRVLISLEKAESILESRFYQKKEKAKFLLFRGVARLKTGNVPSAQIDLRAALDMLPKTTGMDTRLKTLAFYTLIQNRSGNPDAVIETISIFLKDLPIKSDFYSSSIIFRELSAAYFDKQEFNKSEIALKESIQYGDSIGIPLLTLRLYLQLGKIFQKTGKFRDALHEYERVISQARKGGDSICLSEALCMIARLKIFMDKPEGALSLLEEAVNLAFQVGDSNLIAAGIETQCEIFIANGNLDQANDALKKILSHVDTVSDNRIVNKLFFHKSLIAIRTGNWSDALGAYDNALTIARKRRDLKHIAFNYLYMADTLKLMQNFTKSEMYLRRTRRILDHLQLDIPDCDLIESELLLHAGKLDEAMAIATQCLKKTQAKKSLHGEASTHRLLGRIYLNKNKPGKSLEHFQAGLELFDNLKRWCESAMTMYFMGELHIVTKKKKAAQVYFKKSRELFGRMGAINFQRMAAAALDIPSDSEMTVRSETGVKFESFEQIIPLIHSIENSDQLLERIVDTALRITRSDRACMILNNDDPTQAEKHIIRNLDTSIIHDVVQILHSALKRKTGADTLIVCNNPHSDPKFNQLKSIRNYQIRGFAVVPFILGKSISGAIFIDKKGESPEFPEQSLRDLTIFARGALQFIRTSLKYRKILKENRALLAEMSRKYKLYSMIGQTEIMKQLFQKVETQVYNDQGVLITGEPGTGKKLIANMIHYHSHRKDQKLVTVRCSALSKVMIETELFGTAAKHGNVSTTGRVEMANGGTLLLDDITALPMESQLRLIDVITTGEIISITGDSPRRINVRLIATSPRNIRALVQTGSFSEKLYSLIKTTVLEVPSLNARKEDIPLLAHHYVKAAGERVGKDFSGIDSDVLEALQQFSWPGNVAQLERSIDSAVVFGTPPMIQLKDLPEDIRVLYARSGVGYNLPELQSMDDVEEAHIRRILTSTAGNKLRACQLLKISRPTLDRKLEKYNIKIKRNKR